MKHILTISIIFLFVACHTKNEKTILQQEEGELLAKKCINCHPRNSDTEPSDFSKIRQSHTSEWIYSFVRNPDGFATKNAEAKALLEKWKPAVMVGFPNLTNREIDLILDYYESK